MWDEIDWNSTPGNIYYYDRAALAEASGVTLQTNPATTLSAGAIYELQIGVTDYRDHFTSRTLYAVIAVPALPTPDPNGVFGTYEQNLSFSATLPTLGDDPSVNLKFHGTIELTAEIDTTDPSNQTATGKYIVKSVKLNYPEINTVNITTYV